MAANVTTTLNSWSTTESSNRPVTGDTVDVDDELRMIQAVVRKYLATKGADIASAATVDLSTATGNYVHITGTTTITALGTLTAGLSFLLVFDGVLTFTHNATSLILPGAANITTAAGDRCEVVSLGSGNWRCMWYQKANGYAVVAPYLPLAGGTMTGDIVMSAASILEAEGADVASATTCEIWATDGNTRHITGTTTITSLGTATQAGQWQKIIFDGALTLTHGANLNLPGSANITTAAGDFAWVYADTTTQHDVLYFKKDGTPVVSAATTPASARTVRTAGDVSTTSTSLVDMTGASVTLTTGARPVHISFTGTHSGTSTAITYFNVDIDGTAQFGTQGLAYQTYGASGYVICIAFDTAALTAAEHTIKIKWAVNTGTGVIKGDSTCPFILSVHEIV